MLEAFLFHICLVFCFAISTLFIQLHTPIKIIQLTKYRGHVELVGGVLFFDKDRVDLVRHGCG